MSRKEREEIDQKLAEIRALVDDLETVSARLKRAADAALEKAITANRNGG